MRRFPSEGDLEHLEQLNAEWIGLSYKDTLVANRQQAGVIWECHRPQLPAIIRVDVPDPTRRTLEADGPLKPDCTDDSVKDPTSDSY